MLTMPKSTLDREDAALSGQESADDNLRSRMQDGTRVDKRQMESRPDRMPFRSYIEKAAPVDTYQLQYLWSKYVATDL